MKARCTCYLARSTKMAYLFNSEQSAHAEIKETHSAEKQNSVLLEYTPRVSSSKSYVS